MKAEIIAVGTELLLGQIVNTNARFLSEQCANIGLDVYYQTVVGDNVERICSALKIAATRADVIICTGGLGPTMDDLTRDALAIHVNTTLVYDDLTLSRVEEYFMTRNINMIESNRRQALTLLGATALPNDAGMAVGTAMINQGKYYILLPGPPKELKVMFEQYAKSWLRTCMGEKQPLYSLSLKFAGIGESALEDKLVDLIQAQSDPTIAPYAKEGEVMIRLTTRAVSEVAAFTKMQTIKEEIMKRVGDHLYAEEDVSLDYVIQQLLQEHRLTIAAAESCTGGLFSNMITTHPGSSDILVGSVICYTNEAKQRQLGIPIDLLEGEHAPGAISATVAAMMAENVMNLLDADIGISFTGVAGPGSAEGKNPGLVYMGIALRGKDVKVEKLQLSGSREMIKLRACRTGFYQLWKILKSI
jgi:nicotinamide-nucleotide amidase